MYSSIECLAAFQDMVLLFDYRHRAQLHLRCRRKSLIQNLEEAGIAARGSPEKC